MSKCYGWLTSDAANTSRTRRGHGWIKSKVQTWVGSVSVKLNSDNEAWIDIEGVKLKSINIIPPNEPEPQKMCDYLNDLKKVFRNEMPKGSRFPQKEVDVLKKLLDAQKLAVQLKGE